jgi:hypothetical protein
MKAIIFENIEQFEEIENKIQEALLIGIPDYTSDRWALPLYSVDRSKIALQIETEGVRGNIITGIIKGFEVAEIQNTDAFWFSQERLIIDI